MDPFEGDEILNIDHHTKGRLAIGVYQHGAGREPDRWFYRWPEVSRDIAVQVRYEAMREAGQSHRMAEVLATRSFPSVRTDATFNAGRVNGNQFEQSPLMGDHYRRMAEAAGVSTTGKYYSHGLASYPGDPTAWVSDRHDVLAVARAKNMTVRGAVEHRAVDHGPSPDVAIAADLVDREVGEILADNPGLRPADVREKVVELRTGAVDLGDPLRGYE